MKSTPYANLCQPTVIAQAAFGGLILLILLIVGDYGVSWDEPFRANGGEQKFEYYQALFSGDTETAAKLRGSGDRYPGFFDLTAAILRRVSPLHEVTTNHLWSALFGFAGIIGTFALGRLLGGVWTGLAAAALLALAPRYFGHMFINPKDIPFAATFVWGVWAFLRVVGEPTKRTWQSALIFGLCAGVCMATRIGGLLLFAYAGLFLLLEYAWSFHRNRGNFRWAKSVMELGAWGGMAALTAFAILILFWPAMHQNPLAQTTETIGAISSFGWGGTVFFRGEHVPVEQIPWSYLPEMLLRTMPDLWLLQGLIALCVGVLALRHHIKNPAFSITHGRIGALIFVALFPIAYIIVVDAMVYDGIRHVLFLLPLISTLIAIGTISAVHRIPRPSGHRGVIAIAAATAALTIWLVSDIVRLHPYQYIYFNRLSGGVSGADGQFEIEYWATAHREAVENLSRQLPPASPRGDRWRLTMEPPTELLMERFGALVVPPPALVVPFLGENLALVRANEDPDFYISMTRNNYHLMRDGPVIFEIRRHGVLLFQAKLLRPELLE